MVEEYKRLNSDISTSRDKGRSPSSIQAKRLLRRINLNAIKGLGQHFLIDEGVMEKILSAADLKQSDTIVEIGPGLGILTDELSRRVERTIAVEVDTRLVEFLRRRYHDTSQVEVIHANILDIDPAELIKSLTLTNRHSTSYKVVANLPYNIASAVLRHYLEASTKPHLMVVMVQREVAESIVAEPGRMSVLGISVQLYGDPVIIDYVSSASFYPRPKVDSAVVRIDVYTEPSLDKADVPRFMELVKAGFGTRRKQLRNALSVGLHVPPSEIEELLEQAGIEPQRRPQTLSLEEWFRVHKAYHSRGK